LRIVRKKGWGEIKRATIKEAKILLNLTILNLIFPSLTLPLIYYKKGIGLRVLIK
jgi:hypothetical protein